ncbi:MAG: TIM barrel protein [Nitrospinae bacterium]|nr:TIM barrel protein [Nitrospinota bacterium]
MSLCAISTCWRSEELTDPPALIAAMKETGMNALELEFRVGAPLFEAIEKNREAWGIRVSSLHAVCPSAPGRGKGAEEFLISDLDDEQRKRGVRDVIETLRRAAGIGAGAVVLHCGAISEELNAHKTMMRFCDEGKLDGPEAEAAREALLVKRVAAARRPFAQTLKSLDAINGAAVKAGVKVGLENRYYFGEFPLFEEFGVIFNMFDGGNLHYWHDTGHAHTLQTLFGIPHRKMLETFGSRLVGMHLHDVVNGYTDHNEPGCGAVDWDMVKGFLKPDTIRVMEINRRIPLDRALQGAAFLRAKGIFD